VPGIARPGADLPLANIPTKNKAPSAMTKCSARPSAAVALLAEWKDGGCENLRLVIGCVGPRPIRAEEVEEGLSRRSAEEIMAKAEEAAKKAALLCDPLDDFWGSVEYKRQIVKSLILRALSQLCRERTGSQEKSL